MNDLVPRRAAGTPVLVLVPTCVAAILACLFLGAKDFWLDESVSVLDAAGSLRHMFTIDGGNFALYYLLLHGWLKLGASDAFVRLMSVIPAVLCVPTLYAVGRRLFGPRAALVSASVLAINPFFIAYAQEARGYSLLALGSIVSTLCFVRCFEQPESWLGRTAYVVASAAMVYTHLFGILVLAAHAVVLLLCDRRLVPWRVFGACGIAMAVLMAPLGYDVYRQGASKITWIGPLTLEEIGTFWQQLAGSPALALLYAVLLAFFVVDVSRKHGAMRNDAGLPPLGLIASWLFVPFLIAVGYSALVRPVFVPRYLIIMLPPLALFAGYVLAEVRSRAAVFVLAIFTVASSAQGLWVYYFHEPKDDWRGLAALVASRSQPGDVVVCLPPYLDAPLRHVFDQSQEKQTLPALVKLPAEIDASGASLHPYARVWLVSQVQGEGQFKRDSAEQISAIMATLQRSKHLLLENFFEKNIAVRLYVARLPAASHAGSP